MVPCAIDHQKFDSLQDENALKGIMNYEMKRFRPSGGP